MPQLVLHGIDGRLVRPFFALWVISPDRTPVHYNEAVICQRVRQSRRIGMRLARDGHLMLLAFHFRETRYRPIQIVRDTSAKQENSFSIAKRLCGATIIASKM